MTLQIHICKLEMFLYLICEREQQSSTSLLHKFSAQEIVISKAVPAFGVTFFLSLPSIVKNGLFP